VASSNEEDAESALYYPPALSRPKEQMPPATVAPLILR